MKPTIPGWMQLGEYDTQSCDLCETRPKFSHLATTKRFHSYVMFGKDTRSARHRQRCPRHWFRPVTPGPPAWPFIQATRNQNNAWDCAGNGIVSLFPGFDHVMNIVQPFFFFVHC